MYLNIGGDTMVKKNEIMAIMDIENTSVSKKTREFFKKDLQNVRTFPILHTFCLKYQQFLQNILIKNSKFQ